MFLILTGLISKRHLAKALEVSKATTTLLIYVGADHIKNLCRNAFSVHNFVHLFSIYVGALHLEYNTFDFVGKGDTNGLLSIHRLVKENVYQKDYNCLKHLIYKTRTKKPKDSIHWLSLDV